MQFPQHFALSGKEHIVAFSDSAMSQCLGDMAFTGAAPTMNTDTFSSINKQVARSVISERQMVG